MNNGQPKGTAVAYVRISSEEQLKKSATNIATQTKKCAEACERAGLELAKVFTDEEIKEFELKNLAESWTKGDLKYRVDLQFSMSPEGLRWTNDNGFLNKGNPFLYQLHQEFLRDLRLGGGR